MNSSGALKKQKHEFACAFLKDRLQDLDAIYWAIELKDEDIKEAINSLLNYLTNEPLPEPWNEAWRMVQISWAQGLKSKNEYIFDSYQIQRRLENGDRSLNLVNLISDGVSPKIEISKASRWRKKTRPRKPKNVQDILDIALTSGELLDIKIINFAHFDSSYFLKSLANNLLHVIDEALNITSSLGLNDSMYWRLGEVRRVYYTSNGEGLHSQNDIDAFSKGLAPSVKLLFEVIRKLAILDLELAKHLTASCFAKRDLNVFKRLWSALAFDETLVGDSEVSIFLLSLSSEMFWDADLYPEMSELRARRFKTLDLESKNKILDKIKLGPGKSFWRRAEPEKIVAFKDYIVGRELKRIALASPESLDEEIVELVKVKEIKSPQLVQMISVDYDFRDGPHARFIPPSVNKSFDEIKGEARLDALKKALLAKRVGWEEDQAQSATNWISSEQNTRLLISDFILSKEKSFEYAEVFQPFFLAHRPPNANVEHHRNLDHEYYSVVNMIKLMPVTMLKNNISNICYWANQWNNYLVNDEGFISLWDLLLPLAVEFTNTNLKDKNEVSLNVEAYPSKSDDSLDLDIYNSPVSDLTSIFFAKCSQQKNQGDLKDNKQQIQKIKMQLVSIDGIAGYVAKHRLVEFISHWFADDPDWTEKYLIAPLKADDRNALILWRAISRHQLSTEIIRKLDKFIVDNITNDKLNKNLRKNLAWSLVVEKVRALFEVRDSGISTNQLQQMLRLADDEIRCHVAGIVQRFILEVLHFDKTKKIKSDDIYNLIGKTFFNEIWPQELSLVTPTISKILASLPSAVPNLFDVVVNDLSRFLVPFNSFSLMDLGLGDLGGSKNILLIDSKRKAMGLLRLLTLTIDESDGANIPYDLSVALDQIIFVSPSVAEDPDYQRLITISRRR